MGKRLIEDLRVLERLTRDTDTHMNTVSTNQIALTRYGLGDASKGVYVSCLCINRGKGGKALRG